MDKEIEMLYEAYENGGELLTIQEIADALGLTHAYVWNYIAVTYSKAWRDERKTLCYQRSKLGGRNPMTGKRKEQHHNYVGDISDGKGYLMRVKPDWYTGRKGCKHVFVHHIVMCEALGITEVPRGMVVHHVDGNRTNNDLSNLALMTIAAHTRLHQLERATTSRKA